jgi:hypothetical protein
MLSCYLGENIWENYQSLETSTKFLCRPRHFLLVPWLTSCLLILLVPIYFSKLMKDYSRPKLRPKNGGFLIFQMVLNKYLCIFLRLCESHALLNHVIGMYLVKFLCPLLDRAAGPCFPLAACKYRRTNISNRVLHINR